MAKIKIGEANINYEITGDGKELLMLTGMSGSIDYYWVGLMPGLKKKCRVTTLDNRGMGKTESHEETLSIEMMAEDTIGFIRELNLSKPNICGHSMGGAIAMTLAKKYPDEIGKIILLNSFPSLSTRAKMIFHSMTTQLDHGVPAKNVYWSVIPWLYSEKFLSDKRKLGHLRQFVENRTLNVEGFCKQIDALCEFNATNWLPQIHKECLIIAAQDDILTPLRQAELIRESILDSKMEVLEGGHVSHVEEPYNVVKLILDFLK